MQHWSTRILIIALLVVAILSGYNYFKRPFLKRFEDFQQQLEQATVEPVNADPVQAAIDEMTTREKVLQLIDLPIVATAGEATVSAEIAWTESNRPGFVTIFGSSVGATASAQLVDSVRFEEGLSPLVAVDHEGGTVQRLSGGEFTRLPSWRQACAMTSEARKEIFAQSAQELAAVGVQIVFAPDVDVAGSNSFLGSRACTDPDEIIASATDYITEFAQYGILSVVKHFPGIGSLTTDPHYELDSVSLTADDTIVFDRLITSFPNIGIMTTHVAVEGKTDGTPCSLNAPCLNSFLVNFPDLLLFTDALEMRSASLVQESEIVKTLPEIAVQAVLAGNDVLVFGEKVTPEQIEEVAESLASRYDENEVFQRRIDTSLRKILELKIPVIDNSGENN